LSAPVDCELTVNDTRYVDDNEVTHTAYGYRETLICKAVDRVIRTRMQSLKSCWEHLVAPVGLFGRDRVCNGGR
jgi:hypothetical protein